MNQFIFHARTSWRTTLYGVLGFLIVNSQQILAYLAYIQGYLAQTGPFDWKSFGFGFCLLMVGAHARDAGKTDEDHKMPNALPTSNAAAKIVAALMCCLLLSGCASSTGNQDPSLNAALDSAKSRIAEYQSNQNAIAAKEDAALLSAQQAAIAQNLKVSIANWQLISAQKNLPVAEQINETARLYAVANTEQANALNQMLQLQLIRQGTNADVINANALITQVEAANSSTPVSATAVVTQLVNALLPTVNQAAVNLGLSTPTATATVPSITPSSLPSSASLVPAPISSGK